MLDDLGAMHILSMQQDHIRDEIFSSSKTSDQDPPEPEDEDLDEKEEGDLDDEDWEDDDDLEEGDEDEY